jgi:hypothetical protein
MLDLICRANGCIKTRSEYDLTTTTFFFFSRKKLVEWMDYSSDLSKHSINALDPGSTSRGVRPQHSIEEIAKYQKITEEDMQAALDLLR